MLLSTVGFEKHLLCFVVISVCCLFAKSEPKDEQRSPCSVCHEMAGNFLKGLKKTAKNNFGGGNTAWEEKHLGGYAFSETRFIEIVEDLCKNSDKDCHFMLEKNEERLERWWFKEYRQGTDLKDYFCIKHLKVCCYNGTFGEECRDCMGGRDRPCYGNGKCHGEGNREGTGQCECNDGYRGDICDECLEGYYEEMKNKTDIKCTKCHSACETSCWAAGADSCDDCNAGWDYDEELGCSDLNECKLHTDNCTSDQYCANTAGSFKCIDCHKSCQGCTGSSSAKCMSCAEGFYQDDETCVACDRSCETCTGAGNDACLKCNEGFQLLDAEDHDSCVDIDECAAPSPICLDTQFCTNIPGSHKCTDCHKACVTCHGETMKNCDKCSKGYEMDENKHCKDINECEVNEHQCSGANELCVNMVGSFVCNCEPGYEKKNGKCQKSKTKEEVEKEKPKKTKSTKKKKKSKISKPVQSQITDIWLYASSLIVFVCVTAVFRRSWMAQFVFIAFYWLFLFLFSYHLDPIAKKK